jgi:hypothetical protein
MSRVVRGSRIGVKSFNCKILGRERRPTKAGNYYSDRSSFASGLFAPRSTVKSLVGY